MGRRRSRLGSKERVESSADRIAKRLSVPADTFEHPALIAMSGLPGTGKSFVADLLADQVKALIIRTDEVRKILFPRPTYAGWESGIVYLTSYELIRRFLLAGKNVIFDGTNLTESSRKKIGTIADESGSRFLIAVTGASEDVVKDRLTRRQTGQSEDCKSDADWNVFLSLKGHHEPVRGDHWTIDTSINAGPVLDQLAKFIIGGDTHD